MTRKFVSNEYFKLSALRVWLLWKCN